MSVYRQLTMGYTDIHARLTIVGEIGEFEKDKWEGRSVECSCDGTKY
jgi:hypothetical protein